MPTPPVPHELDDVLAQPNPAVVATIQRDGSPNTAATWYLWEGGRILVNMDEGRTRVGHMRREPRVSLTVLAGEDWYRQVTLRGRVISLEDDRGLVDIDRISRHYTGRPYGDRERGRVSAWIEVTHWHAWASAGAWTPS